MGKKDKAKMAKERANFIKGCAETNKIAEKKANAIFDLLEKFAGYGFNKSHSAAYGLISYQTAYLKANFPVEFMAGLLSNEINNTDKISIFVGECKRMGIPIFPPDVNRSGLKFAPADDNGVRAIRYGLAAIKNVGEGAMEAALVERQANGDFTSLEDFCRRLDSRIANRKMLESLVKCGAFDFLGRERAELFDCIEESLAAASASHKDRASGQVSLFDDLLPAPAAKASRHVIPWSEHEKMAAEKELLGFYVTGHPLDRYARTISASGYRTITSLGELADRAPFRIAGSITQSEKKFTKKEGKPFGVVLIEDLTGTLEIVVWNEVYLKVGDELVPGHVIAVQGTLDKRDDTMRATAQKLKVFTPDPPAELSQRIAQPTPGLRRRRATISSHRYVKRASGSATDSCDGAGHGRSAVVVRAAGWTVLRLDAGADMRVNPSADLKQKLTRWIPA